MRRRSRQRGFSLIIVFLLMIIMIGVASTVLIATQSDLQLSAVDRTSTSILYIAELGVARAKEALFPIIGAPPKVWAQALSNNKYRCAATPSNNPDKWTGGIVLTDKVGGDYVRYSWCIHNNVSDPVYTVAETTVVAGGYPPCGLNNPYSTPPNQPWSRATCDTDGILTIEAFACVTPLPLAPCGADRKHITVDVQLGQQILNLSEYAQAGGSATKGRAADSAVANPLGLSWVADVK